MPQQRLFDLGKAFQTGRQGAQTLNYYEDRRRAQEQQERGNALQDYALERQQRQDQTKMQAGQAKITADSRKDLSLIVGNMDPADPNFEVNIDKAINWYKGRNPDHASEADQLSQMPTEEKKLYIGNLRSQMGLDKETDKFERGKPFTNDKGERVVPIYDKNTKELVKTEKLGKEKGKDEPPPIVWTDEQLDFMADKLITTGEKPMKTRGKEANYLNQIVEQLAAKKQMAAGVGGAETTFLQKDRKAIQTSITAQEKQRGSMVSFVANLSAQVDHVKDIAAEINTFDARFLNKPLRWVKKKLKGDPQLSKYEVYLGEIQSEIGCFCF